MCCGSSICLYTPWISITYSHADNLKLNWESLYTCRRIVYSIKRCKVLVFGVSKVALREWIIISRISSIRKRFPFKSRATNGGFLQCLRVEDIYVSIHSHNNCRCFQPILVTRKFCKCSVSTVVYISYCTWYIG